MSDQGGWLRSLLGGLFMLGTLIVPDSFLIRALLGWSSATVNGC